MIQDTEDASDVKALRVHVSPQGSDDNLLRALQWLANLQNEVDSLLSTVSPGIKARSRMETMDNLRQFIQVDNVEAVQIGHMKRNSEAIKVVRPLFDKETFSNAAFSENSDELTLRTEEAGVQRIFINTTEVGDNR